MCVCVCVCIDEKETERKSSNDGGEDSVIVFFHTIDWISSRPVGGETDFSGKRERHSSLHFSPRAALEICSNMGNDCQEDNIENFGRYLGKCIL